MKGRSISLRMLAIIVVFVGVHGIRRDRNSTKHKKNDILEQLGDIPMTMTELEVMKESFLVFNKSYIKYFNLSSKNFSDLWVGPNKLDFNSDDDDVSDNDREYLHKLRALKEALRCVGDDKLAYINQEMFDERLSSPEAFSWSSANEPVEGAPSPLFSNQQIFHRNGELKDFLNPEAEEESSDHKVREVNIDKLRKLLRNKEPLSYSEYLKMLKAAAPVKRSRGRRKFSVQEDAEARLGAAGQEAAQSNEDEARTIEPGQQFDTISPSPMQPRAFGQLDLDDEVQETFDGNAFAPPTRARTLIDSPAREAALRKSVVCVEEDEVTGEIRNSCSSEEQRAC
eukprot:757165-Hanusia_phi.AAC.1